LQVYAFKIDEGGGLADLPYEAEQEIHSRCKRYTRPIKLIELKRAIEVRSVGD